MLDFLSVTIAIIGLFVAAYFSNKEAERQD